MTVTQDTLRKYKWGDLALRSYQLDGVNWLLSCYNNNHGCILSDEMGLGKTCQIIGMLTVIKGRNITDKPHLVVCPRSVLENWEQEVHRFSPALNVLLYIGEKEARSDTAQLMKASKVKNKCDVLLTTYEMCLKDNQFFSSISWDTLTVDEGHRLKNSESLLYKTLETWSIHTRILLTGTPLQNNLRELYSLLSFVDNSKFKLSRADKFVHKFSNENEDMSDLHDLMAPYILRRTKANVLLDLPEKNDVILYHGLSPLQKKLYKAILTKDIGIFESNTGSSSQSRLMNILMQLRKCVNHPYLFDGVESEPYELGEHLVEASHKLTLIDHLLLHLKESGHKVLLFSQMSRMLDILQDYLSYRGYTYERLDGSVRGEERFLTVQNFNANDETFVFLLSTKAGGQGLNLTSADTVIFVDSDFNPQNDLQAAARAHRIGQKVKIIRLIGKHTVEEIILNRAEEKLRLTQKVIDSGDFTTSSSNKQGIVPQTAGQLQEILKFGVDELLTDGKGLYEPADLEAILGGSENGKWVVNNDDKHKVNAVEDQASDSDSKDNKPVQSMYVFEGTDYSREPSAADVKAFEQLIIAEKELLQNKVPGERTLRKTGTSVAEMFMPIPQRKFRKELTLEEVEERKKKNQAAAEKRASMAEEQARARTEAKNKKEALWKANKYRSANIILDSEEGENESEESINLDDRDSSEEEGTSTTKQIKKVALRHVMGDVTHPVDASTDDNIIVHCIDDSGVWGRGGLFSAISARSVQPETQYELAGEMKDLTLGDCHLIAIDDIESREGGHDFLALIVAQHRDKRTNKLSGINLPALTNGLQKIYKAAVEQKASVHLPRIGHDTPGFNWYGTERLLQKYLSSKGIPTYIYYFPRKQAQKRKTQPVIDYPSKVSKGNTSSASNETLCSTSSSSSIPTTSSNAEVATSTQLPSLFSGIGVYFHNVSEEDQKRLKRFIIAFDGDVEKQMTHSITHLITDASTNKLELNDLIKDVKCRVVTPNWLDDCVSEGRLLPTEDYLISLS